MGSSRSNVTKKMNMRYIGRARVKKECHAHSLCVNLWFSEIAFTHPQKKERRDLWKHLKLLIIEKRFIYSFQSRSVDTKNLTNNEWNFMLPNKNLNWPSYNNILCSSFDASWDIKIHFQGKFKVFIGYITLNGPSKCDFITLMKFFFGKINSRESNLEQMTLAT